jgi:hypothetical protein
MILFSSVVNLGSRWVYFAVILKSLWVYEGYFEITLVDFPTDFNDFI